MAVLASGEQRYENEKVYRRRVSVEKYSRRTSALKSAIYVVEKT
jgi:hypothetical protein